VIRGQGLAEVGREKDVDPGVNFESARPGALDEPGEWIELRRLASEQGASGDDPRLVESVPPPSDLDEQGVESGFARLVDHAIDFLGGHEGGADDPKAAHLARGRCFRHSSRRERKRHHDSEVEPH
jgi:hypothetical protein